MADLPFDKLKALQTRFESIEAQMNANPDPEDFVRLSREYAELQPAADAIRAYWQAEASLGEARGLIASGDAELRELAEAEIDPLQEKLNGLTARIRLLLLPKDEADEKSAILELRAGTGGDEAGLFAGDLFRMYSRFAELQGWKVAVLSQSPGEVGGFREIIAAISGRGVYAKLKYESGVHRVQRVPDTETGGRIHTSAATVAVLPDVEEIDIDIRPEDIRIDTMRASGAGGQHVNRTDSAVRITHLPTGIVVQCQQERSQHKNRATAMRMLKARLYEAELQRREAEKQAVEAAKTDIGWGHQIRSYVLQPYQMVKDVRTGVERSDPSRVLDGDIDEFIEAALAHRIGALAANA